MAEAKRGLYFKYLRNEQNVEIDYEFKAPVYGASNTDISYYEPNSSRIANMYKSGGASNVALYDFDQSKGQEVPDIKDCQMPFGRKPGLTFEEVSQAETILKSSLKSEADKIEKDTKEALEQSKKNVKEAVAMAEAIKNPQNLSEK